MDLGAVVMAGDVEEGKKTTIICAHFMDQVLVPITTLLKWHSTLFVSFF